MQERVVIWESYPGKGDYHWYCSVIPAELGWQSSIVESVESGGYNLVYAGVLTPELDAKYPEYAGV